MWSLDLLVTAGIILLYCLHGVGIGVTCVILHFVYSSISVNGKRARTLTWRSVEWAVWRQREKRRQYPTEFEEWQRGIGFFWFGRNWAIQEKLMWPTARFWLLEFPISALLDLFALPSIWSLAKFSVGYEVFDQEAWSDIIKARDGEFDDDEEVVEFEPSQYPGELHV